MIVLCDVLMETEQTKKVNWNAELRMIQANK